MSAAAAPPATEPDATPADRRFLVGLAVTAAVALAVRVAFTVTRGFDPTQADKLTDSLTYHELARGLAGGDGYVRVFERLAGHHVPTAEFPPAFPALLALLDLAGLRSPGAQELALTLVGTATVVLIALVARDVAGPRAGLLAGAVAAVHPMLLLPDATLQAEGLMAALVAAALLLALRARRSPSTPLLLGLGLVVGLAALTRSEGLLLLAVVAVVLRRSPRSVLVVALPALVVVGGWTVRNVVRLDHVVLLSNNSGTLVAGANCPQSWQGPDQGLWRVECPTAIDTEGLDETERTRRHQRVALDHVRDHLSELPRVMAVRVLRVFGLWSPANQLDWEAEEGRDRAALGAGWVVHLGVLAAAVAGAVVARRRRLPLAPLAGCVVLVVVVAALTYGNQRFRVTAEPALVVLAAVAVDAALVRRPSAGAPRPPAPR